MAKKTETPQKTCWPTLTYDDASAAIGFLVDAFGFEERLVVPDEERGEGAIAHAQLGWPEGGAVMLGTTRTPEDPLSRPSGSTGVYVVTDHPDKLYKQATEAGAEIVRELIDEDYGSRGFSARDPEGNIWSFGTYRGE